MVLFRSIFIGSLGLVVVLGATNLFGTSSNTDTQDRSTMVSHGKRMTFTTSEKEYSISQDPLFIFTFQNIAKTAVKDYNGMDPMKYGLKHPAYTPCLPIHIRTIPGGKRILPRGNKDYIRNDYNTFLKPGEKYTEIAPFRELAKDNLVMPLSEGSFEAMMGGGIFTEFKMVKELEKLQNLNRFTISTKEISEKELQKILQDPKTTPGQRLRILKDVHASNRKHVFWQLITNCDDAFAVIMMLEHLEGDWLDVDVLEKLSESKDLSVRGAALRAFSRLGKNEDAAKWLTDFLATQKDGLVLRDGKDALEVLQGTKKPNPLNPPPMK